MRYDNQYTGIKCTLINLLLEYKDSITRLTSFNLIIQEFLCGVEFSKIKFTNDEISQYKEKFYKVMSKQEYLTQTLYEFFRPDGYFAFGLAGFLGFRYFLRGTISPFLGAFIFITGAFVLQRSFKIFVNSRLAHFLSCSKSP